MTTKKTSTTTRTSKWIERSRYPNNQRNGKRVRRRQLFSSRDHKQRRVGINAAASSTWKEAYNCWCARKSWRPCSFSTAISSRLLLIRSTTIQKCNYSWACRPSRICRGFTAAIWRGSGRRMTMPQPAANYNGPSFSGLLWMSSHSSTRLTSTSGFSECRGPLTNTTGALICRRWFRGTLLGSSQISKQP